MTTMLETGQNLREYRIKMGYTQEKLANEAGTSASHLRMIEKGSGNPTFKTLRKLADVLGISLDELLHGRDGATLNDNI